MSVAEPVSLSRLQPSPPLQTGDPHTVLKVFGLTSEISVEGESVTVSVLGAQAIDLGNFTLNVSLSTIVITASRRLVETFHGILAWTLYVFSAPP